MDKTIKCRSGGAGEEFEKILAEAIDDGLNLLGETVKAVLLHLIKERYNIEEHEIPKKIREFSSALRSILGREGGKTIERAIVKCLYSKLGLGTPEDTKDLHEYIFEAYRKTYHEHEIEF